MQAVKWFTTLAMIGCSGWALSDTKGDWLSFQIFNQAPLEIKLGAFSTDPNADLLAAVLWNDGTNNRLNAIRIPPPYDGTGVTSTALENTASLFALGSICTEGNNVIVPYIKDFNLEVARYNGFSWSTATVPGTTSNNFDNANCALTQDGIFLGSHDLTDGETEIFKSSNGGSSYTFYGRYASSGPFSGGIREPLASSFGDRYIMGVYQLNNGQIRVSHTSTAGATPSFTHTPIEHLSPPAGFTFVKEGAGAFNGTGVIFTYNSEGTAKVVDVPGNNPANATDRILGPISNSGSQFTFQGGGVSTFFDMNGGQVTNKAIWGNYFQFDSTNNGEPLLIDQDYPLIGVGGPVATCQVTESGTYTHNTQLIVGGPRVGSTGTDLHIRDVNVDGVFQDGFESSDTTAWFATCP